MMHLARLEMTNFKNYEEVALEFSPGFNCFVGNNVWARPISSMPSTTCPLPRVSSTVPTLSASGTVRTIS
jgi:hypothetical protein